MRLTSLALAACLAAKAQGAPLDVYVLAGQSNMYGQGKWSELPLEDRVVPPGVPYYRPYNNGGFGFVRPISTQFGVEIGLSQELATHASRPFAIVKHAIGSTRLAVEWKAEQGPLYHELIDAVQLAMGTWELQGYEPRLKGLAWMQGEHDAKNASYAAAYQDNLEDFIGAVRHDLHQPLLPVVVGRINVPNHLYREPVRAAQVAVDTSVARVRTFDTDEVAIKDDLVHYNSQGQLQLGRLFAAEFAASEYAVSQRWDLSDSQVPPVQSVPEPSTGVLAALAGLVSWIWRKVR